MQYIEARHGTETAFIYYKCLICTHGQCLSINNVKKFKTFFNNNDLQFLVVIRVIFGA